MTVSQVLNQAADLIEEKGWCQHAFNGPSGSICLLEALVVVTRDRASDFSDACQKLRMHICWYDPMSEWNDQPGRTQDEVVSTLRRAAHAEQEATL